MLHRTGCATEDRSLWGLQDGFPDLPRTEVVSTRLIVSDNRDDPGNPLVLGGDAIDAAAAQDPLAIGKLSPQAVMIRGTPEVQV